MSTHTKPNPALPERTPAMNTFQRPSTTLLTVLASTIAAASLLAGVGEAQARERQTTVTTGNGQAATRTVDRSQGDVSSSTTGPNGKTSSRSVARSDSATTASVTGPNGKTATRATTRTGTGSQTTVTGPNGQTGSVTVTHP